MKPTLLAGITVLFVTSIGLYAGTQQPQQPPTNPPSGTVGLPPAGAPPPQGAPGAAGGQGRGGGRGNPMAAKYTETCLACHGNSTAKGPVGPSLFDAEWVHGSDDDAIVKSIKDGYPDKG